jgi:hypothetical protein
MVMEMSEEKKFVKELKKIIENPKWIFAKPVRTKHMVLIRKKPEDKQRSNNKVVRDKTSK